MTIRSCVFLLLAILICATSSVALEPPIIVKMQTSQGDVLFHHEEHQVAVNDCIECHHEGFAVPRCRDCHGIDPEVPRLKHAFHRQCRNCHIKNGGPTECDTCHDVSKKTGAK